MMKIQIWHSRWEYDYNKLLYNPISSSSLFSNNIWVFPHSKNNTNWINSRETLRDADVFVAEVSYPSLWLWIELWFASFYNKRIICIHEKWKVVSGSIKYITNEVYMYEDRNSLINILKKYLVKPLD